ncbi:hypothetical protein BGZ94_009653 [Podila epigama]|nr:hypothetical protein BGZ94_009653 [Podila epigama]
MGQFGMKDRPGRMIVPPPYGQEMVQEAAEALAAGIPDGIPGSHNPALKTLSDTESATSDDEPEVRVHFEIHLQEDADSEPICPLSEKNVNTLVQELDLTAQERAEVEAIQTKEDLAKYFEKIPRDYDVQIIVSQHHAPDSPGVTFAQNDQILNGDSIAVVRRESISSIVREKKNRRKKERYRRPTTDLSSMPVEEPKASWLAALAHYIGWFTIMWWAWAGQAFWAARYDMDDLFTKVFKLVEFCALISFGAFSSDHLNRTSKGFIFSYVILKIVLVIEYSNVLYWARRNRSKKSTAPLVLQIGSNLTAIMIWSLSTMVHHIGWRYVMWFASIIIEVAVLVTFSRRSSVTFAGSHLPERFALFTIIVLGENVIGIIGLSAGASAWVAGNDPFLVLFLLNTVILYSLWWLYFDDFSEDVFHKTTTLSQLWSYLHLPLHICIVLVGTSSIDLIRLYKLEHHIMELPSTAEHMIAAGSLPTGSLLTNYYGSEFATGFEVPLYRKAAAGGGGGALERNTDYDLTKQYFIVSSSLVFLCNSLIKWINLRSYDRFQKVVYLARFICSMLMLCLLAIPTEVMTPFALLGSMTFFCVVQVGVDLAVIYFGAYGFVEDLEQWAKSARSSVDIGSLLPSPFGGRSRPNSRPGSRPGSIINLHGQGLASTGHLSHPSGKQNTSATNVASTGHLSHPSGKQNTSATNVASFPAYTTKHTNSSSYFPHQQQQQHLALQQQPHTTLSQHQQMELYNMHVNANSLGSSGAYGNLVQALAEIKKRERMQLDQRKQVAVANLSNMSGSTVVTPSTMVAPSTPGSNSMKAEEKLVQRLSLSNTERRQNQGSEQGQSTIHRTQNEISLTRPGSIAAQAAAASSAGGNGSGGLYKVRSNSSSHAGAESSGSNAITPPPVPAAPANHNNLGLATMFTAQQAPIQFKSI